MKINIRPEFDSVLPSATLLINEKSKFLAQQGREIYKLGFGQSPFPVPEEVIGQLCHYSGEKDYLSVQGLPALREVVAQYYNSNFNLDLSPSNIMIGPGSKELIFGIQMVCDADLILPSPSWVSYEPQSHIVRSKVIWVNTKEKDRWTITAEELEKACLIDPNKNKILILNYPNNPTGTSINKEQLQELAEVCSKYGVLVVSDEIYGPLTFHGSHHSIAEFYPEGTVVSGGLSKWCGAGGWRLGTFCFPENLKNVLNCMLALASESFSAVSAPIQHAAVKAYEGSEAIDLYLQTSNKTLREISQYVYKKLLTMNITMPTADGGFYLFPNFKNYAVNFEKDYIDDSATLCERLLEETGIALLPGSAFGRPENEFTCRLSYVDFDGQTMLNAFQNTEITETLVMNQAPKLKSAMEKLSNWLKKYE